jgi:hypothetical protein
MTATTNTGEKPPAHQVPGRGPKWKYEGNGVKHDRSPVARAAEREVRRPRRPVPVQCSLGGPETVHCRTQARQDAACVVALTKIGGDWDSTQRLAAEAA